MGLSEQEKAIAALIVDNSKDALPRDAIYKSIANISLKDKQKQYVQFQVYVNSQSV